MFFLATALPAFAQTLEWTAASGTDLLWSTPANWNPGGPPGAANTVWFDNTALAAGTGSAFVDNIVAASTAIRTLQYSNNTVGSSHNTLLNPGVTLLVSNNVAADNILLVGTGTSIAGGVTNTIIGPGATLIVTNSLGNITLRSSSGGNTTQNTALDMSELDTFNAGVARILIGADAAFNREVGALYLAKTNVIVTTGSSPQISLGDQPSNGVGGNNDPTLEESFLYLGQTNAIFADSMTIGREKSSGAMLFNPVFTNSGTPSVVIRGAATARVANFNVSDESPLGNSNQRSLGLVDFTGGTVDMMVNVANIALGKNGNNTATSASEVGTLTWGPGNVDVNTLKIGCAFVATSTGIGPVGTVNVNAPGTLVVNTVVNLANQGASPATPSTGTLNINGGTATIKGSIVSGGGASAVSVNGGTLNAGFPAVFIGTLAAPITTLTLSNATLTLAPTFGLTNVVATTLNTFSGITNKINIAAMPAVTSYPAQVPLIQFTTFSGDLNTFALGSVPTASPAFQGYVTNDGVGQIYLVLNSGPVGTPPEPPKAIVWNGTPNGNWDTTTLNWTSNGVPASYADVTTSGAGDNVTFDDTLTGTTNVALTTSLQPGSVTLNNTTKNYLFSGTGKLSGATGISMTGSGMVTFRESGGDNYSGGLTVNSGTVIVDNDSSSANGGTTINGGAVQVGNNDAAGVLPSGGITDNGTLIFNRSDSTLVVPTIIAGSGALVHNGSGMVTLSGVETLTGPVTVNAGTLAFAGPNSNPSGISKSSGLTINNGGTVTVLVDNALAGSTGQLPITINAGGTLTGSASLNGGGGASSHIAGVLTLNGGVLTDGGTQLVPGNGTWDLDGGVVVPGGPVTSIISTLDVIPHQSGGTMFNITNGGTPSGVDLNVTGTFINGTGMADTGIIKDGPGVMAFGGTNNYKGGTTIIAGFIRLNNSNAVQNSTITLNVDNGLQFGGGIGTFVLGGLSGANSLSLTDLLGAPVTIQVGNNSTFSGYSGILNGSGGLMKVGIDTLQLTGTNLYTGNTAISNGILQLVEPAALDVTPVISLLSSSAVLDPSGRTDDTVTIGVNQTLAGIGSVNGVLTNLGLVSPGLGASTGVLTVAGNVKLSGKTAMKLDKANATNDLLFSFGSITYGGTLVITNLNTGLAVGDAFQLFSAGGGYSGAFSALQPASPGSGLSWDTNSLAVDGTLKIVVGPVTGPTTNANITKVTLSGTNLLIHGTNNNVPNNVGHFVVLATTNLATPLSSWTPLATNSFNGDGTFDYTQPIIPGTPRLFIDVQAAP
jgi:autotransporter-associated beta strand protein